MSESTSTLGEQSIPASVAKALITAQSTIDWVAKDGNNKFHSYRYATAEAVIDEARRALNPAGLGLMASWSAVRSEAAEQAPSPEPGEKGPRARVIGRVVVRYALFAQDGATVRFETSTPIIVEKGRPEDKGEMAALTANLAYTLRGLLLIPRGDEPETAVDERDDREEEPAPRRAGKAHEPDPPIDDVPFEVAKKEADHFKDVLKGYLGDIAGSATVADTLAVLARAEGHTGLPEGHVNALRTATIDRILAVAADIAELSQAVDIAKRTTAEKSWHDATKAQYQERRRALPGKKAA